MISIIQIPARGKRERELEKVPTISNGVLNPTPNTNKSKNPKKGFAIVATMLKSNISPGETQGEAIVPLAMPNKKVETIDPDADCVFPDGCIIEGIYKSYKPSIESPR